MVVNPEAIIAITKLHQSGHCEDECDSAQIPGSQTTPENPTPRSQLSATRPALNGDEVKAEEGTITIGAAHPRSD